MNKKFREKLASFLRKESRGGIAAIFAVMLGTGVLIGMLGMAYDVGAIYFNQQTLRQSSSAAARALADQCANSESPCASQSAATTFVQTILNNNSESGFTAIAEICGTAPLNSCSPISGRWMDCQTPPVGIPFARVLASTQTASGNSIDTVFTGLLSGVFTSVYHNQLWHCAQADWVPGGTGATSQQIKFNIALPACSYSGGNTPVVLYEFPTSGSNPAQGATCTYNAGGGPVTLTNVAAGYVPFTAAVGNCDTYITMHVGDLFNLDTSGDLRRYCDTINHSLSNYLDPLVNSGTPVHVVLPDSFSQVGGNWQFSVLGFSDFVFLGYFLGGGQEGGQNPPGGWSAYPPGAPSNAKCKGSNYCFYGEYVSTPSFLPTGYLVKLIP